MTKTARQDTEKRKERRLINQSVKRAVDGHVNCHSSDALPDAESWKDFTFSEMKVYNCTFQGYIFHSFSVYLFPENVQELLL